MPSPFNRPLGLILAGGGAHGAWQAGFIGALAQTFGIKFDSILGFSAGALTGTGYFVDRLRELRRRWWNISQGGVMRFGPRLFPPRIYSREGLGAATQFLKNETRCRERARCDLTLVTVKLPQFRRVNHRFAPWPDGPWEGPLRTKAIASCTIPLLFPPVRIEDQGRKEYHIDGGAPSRDPLDLSPVDHCGDVIVVQMVRPDEITPPSSFHPLRRFEQMGRVKIEKLMRGAVSQLAARPGEKRVFHVYPSEKLEDSMLSFTNEACRPLILSGEDEARHFMESPEARVAKA